MGELGSGVVWTRTSRAVVSLWILNNISHVHPCAGYSLMLHSFIAQNSGCLVLAMALHEPHGLSHHIKKKIYIYTLYNVSLLKASGILQFALWGSFGAKGGIVRFSSTRDKF